MSLVKLQINVLSSLILSATAGNSPCCSSLKWYDFSFPFHFPSYSLSFLTLTLRKGELNHENRSEVTQPTSLEMFFHRLSILVATSNLHQRFLFHCLIHVAVTFQDIFFRQWWALLMMLGYVDDVRQYFQWSLILMMITNNDDDFRFWRWSSFLTMFGHFVDYLRFRQCLATLTAIGDVDDDRWYLWCPAAAVMVSQLNHMCHWCPVGVSHQLVGCYYVDIFVFIIAYGPVVSFWGRYSSLPYS